MRRFVDDRGRPWDVVVGRESWGALYALFIPVGAEQAEQVRQTLLESVAYDAAQIELGEMSDAELAALFARAVRKED